MDEVVSIFFGYVVGAVDAFGPLSVERHLIVKYPGHLAVGGGAVTRSGGHFGTCGHQKNERQNTNESRGGLTRAGLRVGFGTNLAHRGPALEYSAWPEMRASK